MRVYHADRGCCHTVAPDACCCPQPEVAAALISQLIGRANSDTEPVPTKTTMQPSRSDALQAFNALNQRAHTTWQDAIADILSSENHFSGMAGLNAQQLLQLFPLASPPTRMIQEDQGPEATEAASSLSAGPENQVRTPCGPMVACLVADKTATSGWVCHAGPVVAAGVDEIGA